MQKGRKILVEALKILKVPAEKEAIDRTMEFVEYFHLVNQNLNLSAHKNREAILINLVIDSLTLLAVESFAKSQLGKAIDVGSGGGIPGIPLAIFRSETHFVLLESKNKKCLFLEEVIAKLNLSNVSVICARAEDVAREKPLRENFDTVLSKALAPLNVALEITIPFLKTGKSAFFYKGPRYFQELKDAEGALNILGCKLRRTWEIDAPWAERKSYLIEIEKHMSTPSHLPRKAGLPQKKPLS